MFFQRFKYPVLSFPTLFVIPRKKASTGNPYHNLRLPDYMGVGHAVRVLSRNNID